MKLKLWLLIYVKFKFIEPDSFENKFEFRISNAEKI